MIFPRTVPSRHINATYLRQFGSMRQILDLSTTSECCNASTCGFLTRKGQCAQGFRNLPHTSVERFQKCGEKPRSADQTPILSFRDLRFCCKKTVVLGGFRFFPALPKNAIKPSVWKRKTCQMYSKSRRHKNRGCPPSGRNLLAELQPMKGFCFSLHL